MAVFVICVICSPRQLVGDDPDFCKGYQIYSRLILTLVFHLYHERDDVAQEMVITCCRSFVYYDVHATT